MQPPPAIPKLSELDIALATPRLKLRQLRETDADALWPYVSDPQVPRMMMWAPHTDKAETLAFIRATQSAFAAGSTCAWAIERNGKACGLISLDRITWELRTLRVDRADMGYWLAPPMWQQGLMTEAALAVLRFGFETLGLHKLTISCLAENVASKRVIEKCGFRYLYRREDDIWRDGAWKSTLRYDMLASEWRNAERQNDNANASITIRAAAVADHAHLWTLLEPVIRAGETYALPRDMRQDEALAFWAAPGNQVFVAEDGNALVGTYFLHANQLGGGGHVANCGYVTAAQATGRGIARDMCRHSLDHARARGFRAMQFNMVVSTNDRAVRLWQSMGFAIVGRLPGAFAHPTRGYVDAFVMYQQL